MTSRTIKLGILLLQSLLMSGCILDVLDLFLDIDLLQIR